MLSINCVGCGRLGKTLLRLFQDYKVAQILGIVNSSLKSSNDAVEFIGAGTAYETIDALPSANIYFITCKDSQIQSFCEQLIKNKLLPQHAIIVHCSGALSSDILQSASAQDCYIASIHPLKSFGLPQENIHNFSGTYCAAEGDTAALSQLQSIFEAIGASLFTISKKDKLHYHAAATLANNYATTLHYYAYQNFIASGIQSHTAKKITSLLMQNAIDNLNQQDYIHALTGPLQRGDLAIIKGHLEVLKDLSLDIYKVMAKASLTLTQHDIDVRKELEKLFIE